LSSEAKRTTHLVDQIACVKPTLYNIGIDYYDDWDYCKAIDYFRQARAIYLEIGNYEDEADAREMINLIKDRF